MSWVYERWYLFTAFLVVFVAPFYDVNLKVAAAISLKIFVGLFLIDFFLDKLIEHVIKIVPIWYVTSLIASATNLPEFGVATVSALKGDPLDVAPSVALGSNLMNLILLFLSFLAVGLIKIKNRLFWASLNLTGVLETFFFALFFLFIANLYYWVLEIDQFYLVFWCFLVIAVFWFYFHKNYLKDIGKGKSALAQINHQELDRILNKLEKSTGLDSLKNFFVLLDDYVEGKKELAKLDDLFEGKEWSTLKNELHNLDLSSFDLAEKQSIFRIFEIFGVHLADRCYKRSVMWVISGLVGIFFCSILLDSSGDDLAVSFNIGKSSISYFVLSFFTSAGEFLTSYKLASMGKIRESVKNVAVSNLVNLLIAAWIVVLINVLN